MKKTIGVKLAICADTTPAVVNGALQNKELPLWHRWVFNIEKCYEL